MNLLLRALSVFATVVVLVLAIVTTAGRIAMHYVEALAPKVDATVSRYGVEIRDLKGSWRGFDPEISATSVRFPGGHAETVTFELDLLESLVRTSIVARRLAAEHLTLEPVYTRDHRWTLGPPRTNASGSTFDLRALLTYSDEISLPDVVIRAQSEASDASAANDLLAELSLSLELKNAYGHHAGQVLVATDNEACATCRLDARWDLSALLADIDLEGRASIDGNGFTLPAPLGRALGIGGATFERLHGEWLVHNGDGRGGLVASARDIGLPYGALDAIDLDVRGATELWHRNVFANFRVLRARTGEHTTDLSGAAFALRSGLADTVAEWSAPTVDVATQVPIVVAMFSNMHWAEEWLPALAPRGTLEGFCGRFSFDKHRLSLAAVAHDVALEHYKGSPYIRDGNARIVGSERGFVFHLDGAPITLGLAEVYPEPTRFDAMKGNVHIWFKDRFLMVRGDELDGVLGSTRARGAFQVTHPEEDAAQAVSLWIGVDSMDALVAKRFVPMKLPPQILEWVDSGVLAGSVRNAAVVFQGYLHSIGELPVRQAEVSFDVEGAAVRFRPEWPLAAAVDGSVVVGTNGVHADLSRARLRGIALDQGHLEIARGADNVRFRGTGTGDGVALRELIRDSPLETWLTVVRPEWTFAGPFDYDIDLTVPIRGDKSLLAVNVDANLRGLDVKLGDLGLSLDDLQGPVSYRYPYSIRAATVIGRMFGEPARFTAESGGGAMKLGFDGHASIESLSRWLDVDAKAMVAGGAGFSGALTVWPGSDRQTTIAVQSDLLGTAIDLPAPFAKRDDVALATTISIEPRKEALVVSIDVPSLGQGWIAKPKEGRMAGRFVLGGAAPPVDLAQDGITVEGAIGETDLGDWLATIGKVSGAHPTGGAIPFQLRGLHVGNVRVRDASLGDLTIDAFSRDGAAGVTVASDAIDGTFAFPQQGPVVVQMKKLKLPAGSRGEPGKDPLAGIDMSKIDADVRIDETNVGDASYGSWQFQLRRDGDTVRLEQLVGDLRGLHIAADEPVVWHWRDPASTHLKAKVTTKDVAGVLSDFGYAPSVETKKARAEVDLTWPGSPLKFALAPLEGTMDVKAEEGRFVDVQSGSGTMRVFSLLNFTTIVKRMSFDFSDVFGKGIAFDSLTAKLAVKDRKIDFVEPMVVDGSGAYFRVGGRVDLGTGELDNEMIVTLPVNKSLPWYAAYLAFINPIAAGAVIVGERLFRSQIRQLSSATYKVKGTLEDPQVTFVGILGRTGDTASGAANGASTKPLSKASKATPKVVAPSAGAPAPAPEAEPPAVAPSDADDSAAKPAAPS